MSLRWGSFSSVFLRCALGLGFLSAIARLDSADDLTFIMARNSSDVSKM